MKSELSQLDMFKDEIFGDLPDESLPLNKIVRKPSKFWLKRMLQHWLGFPSLEGQINELRQENADLRVKIGRLSGRVKYLRSLTKELSGGRMVKATTWLTVYPLEDGKDLIDAIKHGIVLNDSVVFTDPALTQIANRTACCDETVTKYIKIYKDVKEIN